MLHVATERFFEQDDAHQIALAKQRNAVACDLLLAKLYQHHPDHAVAALKHIEPKEVVDLVPPQAPTWKPDYALFDPAQPKRITIDVIQRAVCEHFKVTILDLQSPRRDLAAVRPRQMAMYLAKKLTANSLPQIGRRFGNRDHTTVMSAVRKMEKLRAEEARFDSAIRTLTERLTA